MDHLDTYNTVIELLRGYLKGWDARYVFLNGGCYWLAMALHEYIPGSEVMVNYTLQHSACRFDGGLYDVSGRISGKGFRTASWKDHRYMEKHYRPCFDVDQAEQYLRLAMGQYRK